MMDQAVSWTEWGRDGAAERLAAFISGSIADGQAVNAPFSHLQFDRIFPAQTSATMLAGVPEATDYRPMHGRSKGHDLADGTHTRVKIDLFPEYIRNLPPDKRVVWDT